jgi:hypothetical protein
MLYFMEIPLPSPLLPFLGGKRGFGKYTLLLFCAAHAECCCPTTTATAAAATTKATAEMC